MDLEKSKFTLVFLLLGLLLVGFGVLGGKILSFSSGPKVEILGEGSENLPAFTEVSAGKEVGGVIVEIAGEVIKPGVYELKEGSRVNDLLVESGGLAANADRGWVEKNINLAEKLVDGKKVYIPSTSEILNSKSETRNNDPNSNFQNSKININTASGAELDTLWGVGPATAQKIIEGRPYQSVDELLKKKIIKSNVWEAIKDKITIY